MSTFLRRQLQLLSLINIYFIVQQGQSERSQILEVILKNEDIDNKETCIREMAAATNHLSGSDLKELCRHAALFRVRDYINMEGTAR